MSDVTPPPPPATPPPYTPPASPGGSYPATLTFDPPEKIARWRVIGNPILAIPQVIVTYVLAIVAEILVFVAWILGVITGKVPEGLLSFIALYIRYNHRVSLYSLFVVEEYPPFSFDTTFTDPGDYPRVKVDFVPETEGRNRLTIFFRGLLIIPHFILLFFLGVALSVVLIIGWVAVLITGSWPAGLRDFVINVHRWSVRLSAYMFLLTDEFPPFGFSE